MANEQLGFDPSRIVLEHYSTKIVSAVRSVSQRTGDKDWHWRGKPCGFWVSAKGKDDWPSWCRAEDFATNRLAIRHRVYLMPNANVLLVTGEAELRAFDARYGRDERLRPSSNYSKRLIDWRSVALDYDGIIIAPYVWECRLDPPVSDWYYGWDCASGVIWNARAIAAIAQVEAMRPTLIGDQQ